MSGSGNVDGTTLEDATLDQYGSLRIVAILLDGNGVPINTVGIEMPTLVAYIKNQLQGITIAGSSLTIPSITALLMTAPISVPAGTGVLYMDAGEILTLTDGATSAVNNSVYTLANITQLFAELPRSLPNTDGTLWLNDGIVTLTDGGIIGVNTSGMDLGDLTAILASAPVEINGVAVGGLYLNDGIPTIRTA